MRARDGGNRDVGGDGGETGLVMKKRGSKNRCQSHPGLQG